MMLDSEVGVGDIISLRKLTTDELIEKVLHLKSIHEKDSRDFEEYKASSQELEAMMEKEIEDAQREIRATSSKLHQVRVDFERAQVNREAEKRELLKIEEALRREVVSLRNEQETNRARIRELEQRNDDLERHERNNQQEVTDLERKVNEMTERLTLLENELAEKQTTAEEMYRLREEIRAADRPLLMVGPLRAERMEDTPEEPTPVDQLKCKQTDVPQPIMHVDEVSEKPNGRSPSKGGRKKYSSKNSHGGADSRSFASCVNGIVKDLMLKVDRLENILTGLRMQSAKR